MYYNDVVLSLIEVISIEHIKIVTINSSKVITW